MVLSYQGVEFAIGDRLLLTFEDTEWIVFDVPSIWDGKGIPLDDSGFRIIDEVLFPDSVEVLHGRDTGFSLDNIIPTEDTDELRPGMSGVATRADGTIYRFKTKWTDDEGLYTTEVLDIDLDFYGSGNGWRLLGVFPR